MNFVQHVHFEVQHLAGPQRDLLQFFFSTLCIWLTDIEIVLESFHSTQMLFHAKHINVTMSGSVADETTIEIESKFTQIIWIVFGKRLQKTFLYTPDWDIPFVQIPPPIIFNKTYPIWRKHLSDLIIIIITTRIHIMSNRLFRL